MRTVALALLVAALVAPPTGAQIQTHPLIGTWTCRRDSVGLPSSSRLEGGFSSRRWVHLRETMTFEADGRVRLISEREGLKWEGTWDRPLDPENPFQAGVDTTIAAYTVVDTIHGLWKAGSENVSEGAPLLIEWKTPSRWSPSHPTLREYTRAELRLWYWEESRIEVGGESNPWVIHQAFGAGGHVVSGMKGVTPYPYWRREQAD